MRLGTLVKKAWVPGLGWYKSPRAGRRVKASVTAYPGPAAQAADQRAARAKVAPIEECVFLGFTFRQGKLRWSDRAFEDFQAPRSGS